MNANELHLEAKHLRAMASGDELDGGHDYMDHYREALKVARMAAAEFRREGNADFARRVERGMIWPLENRLAA